MAWFQLFVQIVCMVPIICIDIMLVPIILCMQHRSNYFGHASYPVLAPLNFFKVILPHCHINIINKLNPYNIIIFILFCILRNWCNLLICKRMSTLFYDQTGTMWHYYTYVTADPPPVQYIHHQQQQNQPIDFLLLIFIIMNNSIQLQSYQSIYLLQHLRYQVI